MGYPIIESQSVPSNLVKGGSGAVCSAAILCNATETEVFQWGNIAIELTLTQEPVTA
ncbi:MAG: hypothetical protein IPN29_01970 [Saprospiraceae bacterium]|nr:hypothetical protein [Saprospiraceae bacterium]